MSSIAIENLQKMYGRFEAIPSLSLDIADGEFVILVGPSGCGKSTLLRMIAGLESITRGEIHIDKTVVNNLMPKERDIAMVFQSYALYPHMSVRENMGFSLSLEKRSADEINERVDAAGEILGLGPLMDRLPKQLSGGQRQRVAMGRAIVRDPKVFLFDEPLSNLDAKLRVQMRAEIKALHERLKTTIVYVTHDQVEAMTMADRIVVMNSGHIEQVGPPLELYDAPANLFVAEFLGSPSMNLVPGTLDGSISTHHFISDEFTIAIPTSLDVTGKPNLVVGFRPEHVHLTEQADTLAIDAKVTVIEPTGSATLLTAQIGSVSITCELRERINLKPGEAVRLFIDAKKLHFFDVETGARISA